MKKSKFILLGIVALFSLSLSAEITREQADAIVLEYIQNEITWDYALLRNDNQPNEDGKTSVTWYNGNSLITESLSVEYPCWVYFVHNPDANGPSTILYLFVNQEDGNLLAIKKDQAFGVNIENWTKITIGEVTPVTLSDFVLPDDFQWPELYPNDVYLFNSQQQLAPYITGTEVDIDVDFEEYSLLAVHGWATYGIEQIDKRLQEISSNKYQLDIDITLNDATVVPRWTVSLLVPKISDEAKIRLFINGKENPLYRKTIIDKWKLTEISTAYNYDAQNPETVDYSNDNIIYDFLTDNQLEISGYIAGDLTEGEHFYSYERPHVGPSSLPGPNLTIDNDDKLYCLALTDDDKMTITGEKVTGKVVDETGLTVEQGTVVRWTKTFIKLK